MSDDCRRCHGDGTQPWSHLIYRDGIKLPDCKRCNGTGKYSPKKRVGKE